MTQLLFRNRWFALLWAVAICFSISRFFGDGGGQEQLKKAADDIRNSRVAASRVEAARAQSAAQQDFEESQAVRGRVIAEDPYGRVDVSESQASESEAY